MSTAYEPAFMTMTQFAHAIGVTRPRVSQMIHREGMPYDHKRSRVPVDAAREWIAAEKRLRVGGADAEARVAARAERERHEAELARLKVEERAGRMIDRAAVTAIAFERARFERNAHLGFAARCAPLIAAETGGDPAAIFAVLDREMRAHLIGLAETQTPELTP